MTSKKKLENKIFTEFIASDNRVVQKYMSSVYKNKNSLVIKKPAYGPVLKIPGCHSFQHLKYIVFMYVHAIPFKRIRIVYWYIR